MGKSFTVRLNLRYFQHEKVLLSKNTSLLLRPFQRNYCFLDYRETFLKVAIFDE